MHGKSVIQRKAHGFSRFIGANHHFIVLTVSTGLSACQIMRLHNWRQTDMTQLRSFFRLVLGLFFSMGCLGEPGLALNLGSSDSVSWQAHVFSGTECAKAMTCNHLADVNGDNEPDVFRSYVEGPISLSHAMADGVYDVTLLFAEPRVTNVGERLFNVILQNEVVLENIDVLRYRDGQPQSALTVTFPQQVVRGGKFQLALKPVVGQPILSGVLLEPTTHSSGVNDQWQLVWQDLFDGSALNLAHWTVDTWPPGKVNNEDQAYTASRRNLRIENGLLVLEAHRHQDNGPAFTSARIHTRGKHDFLYGRVEVIARLPDAQGTWPAIWLLPSDPFKYASNCEEGTDWQGNRECDAWPNSGEIDLMEHVGFESGHIHGTVHTAANYWVNGQQRKGRLILPPATSEFHLYALEWRPDRIDIFVDETRYFSYHRDESDAWQAWPFDQPFHLILNLAVGGNWGRAGGPIAEHEFPQKMLVDSVKVYHLAK